MKQTSILRHILQFGSILLIQLILTILLIVELAFLQSLFGNHTFLENLELLISFPYYFAILAMILGELVFILFLRTYSGCRVYRNLKRVTLSGKLYPVLLTFLIAIIFMPINAGLVLFIGRYIPARDDLMLQALYNARGFGRCVISIISLAVIPAIAEELYFRRYMQRILILRFGAWGGILITSLFFATMHLNLVDFTSIFILSLLNGYVYYISKDILYPFILHFGNNAIVLFLGILLSRDYELSHRQEALETVPLYAIIPCTLGVIFVLKKFNFYFSQKKSLNQKLINPYNNP